ncbi:MAG: TonB-dependent receptor [Crocinitomicaceae bacterium]|nr:TonB-dependent receptor [Crocinitomicaceae bacterium]
MKVFFSTIFLLISLCAHNQTVRVEVTVNPDVAAEGLGKAVIFSLSDSTLVKGNYMDSSFYTTDITAALNDTFYLKLIVPEYLDTSLIFIVDGNVMQLGTIQMRKNLALDEVEVVYKRPMFERTMNGIKVNVNGTSLAQLNTLFDVMKASPRLTSPDEESIEIIGKGSPLILIDRQTIISNEELKAIPADQVDRIEIITNPSAKYKAQGSGSGVIEVYTKNFSLEGYQASIRAVGGLSTQIKPTGATNIGFSFKKKKFSINSYFGVNYQSSNSLGNGFSTATDSTDREYDTDFYTDRTNIWQYYSLKSAYAFNDSHRLTLGLNGNGSRHKSRNTGLTNYYTDDTLTLIKSKESEYGSKWLNNSAFLNYTWETDTMGSAFEINLNYLRKKDNQDEINLSEIENPISSAIDRYDVQAISKNQPNIAELRVNYEHYFDTTGWIVAGGGDYGILINGKRFDQSNLVGNEWILDNQYSNSYDYREDIIGGFAEVSKQWKKIGFRVGMRTEYTKLYGFSKSLNQKFMDSNYLAFFPNIGMLWEPNDKLGITLYYDKGIDRPQFSNYDPFVKIQDSLNIEYGNPNLRPSYEHSIGLEVDLFYAYNISVTYNRIDEPVSYLNFIRDGSFLSEETPFNADFEESWHLNLSLPIDLKWMNGWNSIWVSRSKYEFTEEFNRETFYNTTFGVYSYLTFNLPAKFSIMNRLSISKWGGDAMTTGLNYRWGIRLTKKFEESKFRCFAEVANILPNKQQFYRTFSNYETYATSQNKFTTFKLGLSHKFGRLKAPTNIKDSSSDQSGRI